MAAILRIENLGKAYRLGVISRKTLWQDLKRRMHGEHPGKPDDPTMFWALRDVSFEVQPGEVVGLLGRNGAGKSTLLKILSQITTPTEGRILLNGRVASLLEVGTGFHPELTGRQNVFLNGTILGMSRREIANKFDEIIAFSGIEEFIDTPVKRYSVGMRVRLAFAVAAHLEPEILMIDEVLAVGDAVFQQKCLGKIGEVAHSGRTVLFVSHNAAAIESLCTRGVVLERGRMVFDGSQMDAVEFHSASASGSAAQADLRSRKDRSGSGEVQVVGMEIRNPRGNVIGMVRSGDDVTIALQYERMVQREFPRLAVQISVQTHLGAPVFSHANWLTGEVFGELPEKGTFICQLQRLPLPAGHYRVGFRLQADLRERDPLDAIETAVDLHVEAGNFFGTGKLPPIQQGVCLVDGSWRLEEATGSIPAPTEGATARL